MNGKQTQRNAAERAVGAKSPAVTPEERRRLAECCAFFKAEQHREAEPGKIRESDVRNAEEEIERVIESCRAGAGSARCS